MGARLFYIMGSSGSGKDTLLKLFREKMEDLPCLIAHRYITRKPEMVGENHIWVPEAEFEKRVQMGAFAMHWEANGERYGIGSEVDQWLQLGINVLVNGSREYLPMARQRYGELLVPVLLQVDRERLRQRLVRRGRESPDEITERMARDKDISARLPAEIVRIDNNNAPEEAVDQLLALVGGNLQKRLPPSVMEVG